MNKETKTLITIGVATILLLVGGSFFFTRKSDTPQTQKVVDTALLVKSDSHRKGVENPKVTVVEFGDFECPSCAASVPVINQILSEYPDSVQFVFRNFPLPMHSTAMDAARAAEAANEQGKYWEMYDLIYTKQAEWAGKSNAIDLFSQYAQEIGLSIDDFKKHISEKRADGRVNADLTDGNAAGVNATPTFYINGVQYVGVLSASEFKAAIDAAILKVTN